MRAQDAPDCANRNPWTETTMANYSRWDDIKHRKGAPSEGAGYVTSRRIVRMMPAASGTATQKTIENEICGT